VPEGFVIWSIKTSQTAGDFPEGGQRNSYELGSGKESVRMQGEKEKGDMGYLREGKY
jgi:hypothetical protein